MKKILNNMFGVIFLLCGVVLMYVMGHYAISLLGLILVYLGIVIEEEKLVKLISGIASIVGLVVAIFVDLSLIIKKADLTSSMTGVSSTLSLIISIIVIVISILVITYFVFIKKEKEETKEE